MIVYSVPGFVLQEVADPGIPNKERIVIWSEQAADLAGYGVSIGLALADGSAMPMWDQFFWFGTIAVPAQTWIVLFTSPGKFNIDTDKRSGRPVFNFYWNKQTIVFNLSTSVPLLFQFAGVTVGKNAGAPVRPTPPPPLKSPVTPWLGLGGSSVTSEHEMSLEELLAKRSMEAGNHPLRSVYGLGPKKDSEK